MSPSKIPLARIIRKIDGPIAMLPCVSLYFYERCRNCDEKHCGLHDIMILVRDANLKILEKKTVADLAQKILTLQTRFVSAYSLSIFDFRFSISTIPVATNKMSTAQ